MSDDRIGFTRETEFATSPSSVPRLGNVERDGDAVFECPECFTALRTEDAQIRTVLSNGLRFQGIVCPTCGKSYTFEILDKQE